MPPNWLLAAIAVVILMGALCAFSQSIVHFFIYFPEKAPIAHPSSHGLDFEEITFHADDGIELNAWFFDGNKGLPAILLCHGNAGNMSHCLPLIELLNHKGFRIFIFDYRGYGKSQGRPSERGLYLDGMAAYDSMVRERDIAPSSIIPFGHSLGSSVAIEIALQRKVRAVILESAFTSIKAMAGTILLFKPFAPLLEPSYNNLDKISGIPVPKLFIHGTEDDIVPFSMGQTLYHSSTPPRYFLPVEGAGHNDIHIVGGSRYSRALETFARHSAINSRPPKPRNGPSPP